MSMYSKTKCGAGRMAFMDVYADDYGQFKEERWLAFEFGRTVPDDGNGLRKTTQADIAYKKQTVVQLVG